MLLFQDQTAARNRYHGDTYPIKEDAAKGLCPWNRGSWDIEDLRRDTREMFRLPYKGRGDETLEHQAEQLAVELATFSYQTQKRDFGTEYLARHLKQGVHISPRNLGKFSLEQLFIPSWQANHHGGIMGCINLDSRYGIALQYKHFPLAVMGLYVDTLSNQGIINQLQSVNSFRGAGAIRRKLKWTHALVEHALDWFSELGIKSVVLKGVRNNHWAHHNFNQLVSLGLPVTSFEEAMKMDSKTFKARATETIVKKKDELCGQPVIFSPGDGFRMYDLTARRTRWKGKRFEEREDGNYYMQLH